MNKHKTSISLLLIIFVNFVFGYKYLSRITDFALTITILVCAVQYLSFYFIPKLNLHLTYIKLLTFSLITFIFLLNAIAIFNIPVTSLNVDRWSIISSFLTELFKGNYPYLAESNVGNPPGPMPIYFLIALPFYLVGELSLLSSLGYLILTFIILKQLKNNKTDLSYFPVIYLVSFFMIWEITTRSNIFSYSILALLALYHYQTVDRNKAVQFYLSAVITGLALSTRSVYVLAYIIFFLPDLISKQNSTKQLITFLSVAGLAFISTFIPLLIAFSEEFWIMNPFIVQSSFLVPTHYIMIFISFSLGCSLLVKNTNDKYFFSGISLFFAILTYSIYHIFKYGFIESYINSKIDISYFIFCLPFFTFYLLKNSILNNKQTHQTI